MTGIQLNSCPGCLSTVYSYLVRMLCLKDINKHYVEKNPLESSLVERKKVHSEDRESTSNKSSGGDGKLLCREHGLWEVAAINNNFPGHSHLLYSTFTFLQLFYLGWNWGRLKCCLQITQSSQPRSWAVHHYIKLGLTSLFSPAVVHQNSHF